MHGGDGFEMSVGSRLWAVMQAVIMRPSPMFAPAHARLVVLLFRLAADVPVALKFASIHDMGTPSNLSYCLALSSGAVLPGGAAAHCAGPGLRAVRPKGAPVPLAWMLWTPGLRFNDESV